MVKKQLTTEEWVELNNRIDKLEQKQKEKEKEELQLALNQFYYCGNLTIEQQKALSVIEKYLRV